MDEMEIIEKIKRTESPLKRQLLMVALITNLLEQKGKNVPVVIGCRGYFGLPQKG